MEKYSIEKGINSVTPSNVKAKEGPKKNSRGPMFLSNAYGKVRSRYLGAPMGSCHDLCKFGHKHEFDEDVKHATFRRFMTNIIVSDAVQNHVRGLNNGDRKKSSGLKIKASENVKDLQQNMQPDGKEVENPVETSIKIPSKDDNMAQLLLLEKIALSKNPTKVDSQVDEVNHIKVLNSKKKKKKQAVKPKASPAPEPFLVKQNILKQMNSSASAKITSGGGPNIFKEKVASYMKETVTSSALKVNRQKNTTVRKPSASSRFHSAKINVCLPSEKIDGYAKPTISLKARVPLVRSIAQLNATRNLNGSRNFNRKASKNFKMPKIGQESHDDNQEIIEGKSKNEDMDANSEKFSKEGDGYTSESCVSELSEIEDIKRKQNCKLSGEEEKRRLRRTPYVQHHDNSSPYKMKFKRGRVIDLGATEYIGPRRLRFRRGRVLDENSNGEGMKKIFRRRDMGDTKAQSAVAHASSSEASTVMLKHQDAQEKKDIQALFNHVIEETASKLVKSRKSKVKALVGAFETVISLQETKAAQLA